MRYGLLILVDIGITPYDMCCQKALRLAGRRAATFEYTDTSHSRVCQSLRLLRITNTLLVIDITHMIRQNSHATTERVSSLRYAAATGRGVRAAAVTIRHTSHCGK